MGRKLEDIGIHVSLSAHSSEQDEIDERRWVELVERVEDLCKEYNDIQADVW